MTLRRERRLVEMQSKRSGMKSPGARGWCGSVVDMAPGVTKMFKSNREAVKRPNAGAAGRAGERVEDNSNPHLVSRPSEFAEGQRVRHSPEERKSHTQRWPAGPRRGMKSLMGRVCYNGRLNIQESSGMSEFPLIDNTQFDPEDEYRPEPESEPQPPSWMDGTLRIGIHTSIAGSHLNALESAKKLGCNALQIFSASPRMWHTSNVRIPESDAKSFRARRAELGLGPLVIHANYLINLAAAQPMLRTRSIQGFHEEMVRAVLLGADFLVVHPGARGESSMELAIATIVESVKQAARGVPMRGMRILIENTAGMGTAVGSRLEEVAQIVRGLGDMDA